MLLLLRLTNGKQTWFYSDTVSRHRKAPVTPQPDSTAASRTPAADALGARGLLLAKALSHPVRVEALRILSERVASPSDMARELELPVANVSYHVNTLLRLGFIEEVEHRHVRGSIEHLYRAIQRPIVWSDEWDAMPESAQNAMSEAWFKASMKDLRTVVEEQWFMNFPDHHLTRAPLRLDEQAWSQVSQRLAEVLDWAIGLQAEAAKRLEAGQQGGREVSALMITAYVGRLADG